MISPTARNGIWRAIAIVLLLGNGCSADTVEIALSLENSFPIHYDRLRLVRFIDGQPSLVFLLSVEDPQGTRVHSAGITLRRGTTEMVRMDAIRDTSVVGQANFKIGERAGEVTVKLVACQPFPDTPLRQEMCVPLVGDGSLLTDAGTDTDGGVNADTGVLLADANDPETSPIRWQAPVCQDIDPDALTPPLPPPLASTPACDQYCAEMGLNCSFVYGSDEVCHLACAKMDWPVEVPYNDSVTCRTNFARSAPSSPNQTIACEKAGLISRGSCDTPCENYCRAGIRLCPTEFPPELSLCKTICLEAQEAYGKENPGKDFLAERLICKVSFLEMAISNPTLCQLAGPNACGTGCQPVIFPPE